MRSHDRPERRKRSAFVYLLSLAVGVAGVAITGERDQGLFLFLAVLVLGFAADALYTGSADVQPGPVYRATSPFWFWAWVVFWITIGVFALSSLVA